MQPGTALDANGCPRHDACEPSTVIAGVGRRKPAGRPARKEHPLARHSH